MTKQKTNYKMAAVTEADIGPVTVEEFRCGTESFKLMRPAVPERLLDLAAVADAYADDEYMPYWATLWPVAKYLTEEVLKHQWPAGTQAIELGCGLGLPGLAGLKRGLQVLFTDYDATALKFVEANAALNGFTTLKTELVDWRTPLGQTFEVILASDLTYEARNVEPLVASFDAMLAPQGTVLVADQNRAHSEAFRRALSKSGFVFEMTQIEVDKSRGRDVPGTVYRIKRSNQPK
ncbi:MAG: methyltransferase [Deltaproteobacteria bacterium]|nr:methyltransferase [Deltaproteobacteria bacterium]